jgi:CBS domain-containing protein
MSPTIASMMERQVRTLGMDDTLAQVEGLFAREGLSWAPVLESGGAVLGVVSAADLMQFRARQQDANTVRAWQLCTYKPITVGPDTPVSEVARLMVDRKIHHVVVADAAGIAGVVSSLDFVRAFVRD